MCESGNSVKSGNIKSVSSICSVDALPGVDSYLKRRRGSSSVILPPSSLKDLVQYVNKKRRASVGLIELDDLKDIFRESSSLSRGKSYYSSGPLWEQDATQRMKQEELLPRKNSRQKSNLLDKNTLYSIRRENIASRDMVFREKPIVSEEPTIINNVEQKSEREYILKARLHDNTQIKFEGAIMKHFFKAPVPKSHPGYGMPRPGTREENPFKVMMADLQRDPSIVKVNSYPALSNPKKCCNNNDFCDVLGSASCSTCIETTNRYIADELQRIMFPKIDMTRSKLVKPGLAKIMKQGHLHQIRKRKIGDLDYAEEFLISLRRQETQLNHLSGSALMNLKRSNLKPKKSSTIRKSKPRDLSVINEDFSKMKTLKSR